MDYSIWPRFEQQGVDRLKRTVYIVFVPDEEMGGERGMAGFVHTDAFKAMNVAFVLGEGGSALDTQLPADYAKKNQWQTEFIFHGDSGHSSKLFGNTAAEKLNYVVNKLTEYREEEKHKLNDLEYPDGNVTSINLTIEKEASKIM